MFKPKKAFFILVGLGVGQEQQTQLARPLTANRFCILRERNSTPTYRRNFMLLAPTHRCERPLEKTTGSIDFRASCAYRKNCVFLRRNSLDRGIKKCLCDIKNKTIRPTVRRQRHLQPHPRTHSSFGVLCRFTTRDRFDEGYDVRFESPPV